METIDLKEIGIVPHQALETTLQAGAAVFDLLEDEEFQANWDRLYKTCSWATVFQSRAYVTTWYRLYQEKHLPVLIKGMEGGQLKGLLAVAALNTSGISRTSKNGRIVGAGHFDAEYQVWLAEEADDGRFIHEAILALQNHFPGYQIRFRYLPPQTPLQWIEADRHWKSNCVLQAYRRPYIEINEANVLKMVHQNEFKRKFNKLKKEGFIQFDRIQDKEPFYSVIDELVTQFDFRQSARFNKNSYRENPMKKTLLLELFERELLHVSVLKLNDSVMASIVAIAGKGCIHLNGINTHTPLRAKYYSPGILHFRLLSQCLLEEGFTQFDLTPGGDSYKDRMATGHDQVQELLISQSFISRLKRQARKFAYAQMIKAGMWPMGMEVSVRKRMYLLKARLKRIKKQGIFHYLLHQAKESVMPGKQIAYLLRSEQQMPADLVAIRKDSLEDLLDFEARGTWVTRWEFLETAMHRLEAGQHAYTWSEGGRLLGCAWLEEGPTPGIRPRKGQPPAKGAVLLKDIYCHPDGQSRLEGFLAAVVTQAACYKPEEPFYALVPDGDKTLRPALEAIGFYKVASSRR
jgi:CelD/BcsL family acetyltransferase involved in cellulose biosynthesis